MPIEKVQLQAKSGRAPSKPREEGFGEWFGKMTLQELMGGTVQYGVNVGAEYALNDMKTKRSIKIARETEKARLGSDLVIESRRGMRGHWESFQNSAAALDQVEADALELRGVVDKMSLSVGGSKSKLDPSDFISYANGKIKALQAAKKAALERAKTARDGEGSSDATVKGQGRTVGPAQPDIQQGVGVSGDDLSEQQINQTYDWALDKWKANRDYVSSTQFQKTYINNPKGARNALYTMSESMLHGVRSRRASAGTVLLNMLDFEQQGAGVDEKGGSLIPMDREAVKAFIDNDRARRLANGAWRYGENRYRERYGDAKFKKAFREGRGSVKFEQWMMPPWLRGDDPTVMSYRHNFPVEIQKSLGIYDPKFKPPESLNRSFFRGDPVKGMSKEDRGELAVKKVLAPAPLPEVTPAGEESAKKVQGKAGAPPQGRLEDEAGPSRQVAQVSSYTGPDGTVTYGMSEDQQDKMWAIRDKAGAKKYKMKHSGQSLEAVAKHFGVPVGELARMNPFLAAKNEELKADDLVYVPRKRGVAPYSKWDKFKK